MFPETVEERVAGRVAAFAELLSKAKISQDLGEYLVRDYMAFVLTQEQPVSGERVPVLIKILGGEKRAS